jgi:hypothetical protein
MSISAGAAGLKPRQRAAPEGDCGSAARSGVEQPAMRARLDQDGGTKDCLKALKMCWDDTQSES